MYAANRPSERATQVIIRLCYRGLDARTLRRSVFEELQRVVPYEAYWCASIDPVTCLFTSAVLDGFDPQVVPSYLSNEFLQDDFNKFSDLAKRRQPVATLHMATRGDLARSARYREILEPAGLGAEMRAVFRLGRVVWGGMCLHRERRYQDFSSADLAFFTALAPHLAAGLRAALLLDAVDVVPAVDSPGLLLLAEDLSVIATTSGAEALLAVLDDWSPVGALPQAVLTVVAKLRALEGEPHDASTAIPRARLRTRSGQWLALHASRLATAGAAGQIAVIIERATPNDVAPLVLQAYALTARELEVAGLVLKGRSTDEIAVQLCISTLTVQQHLKAVFDKVGVRSRRELVAQLFAQSYWPSVAGDHGVSCDHWSPA
jgi:DNA-binding CsgD family transcriptional regulator